ncbi:uncharacterized protein PV07_09981 [Cladophialophora immunda]|uniref:Xylanolytic transcriptional activator regulatory domain-containing protein n=1 Tax=Cladophialophora immunda TaxID=569365 RepID=A0A0D2BYM6_9EURO|nr:uncharacterized protein PV07_09981 [Cladophialophora immunda]KIW24253.1 hypothetical protein PV07_09981 [Cladophialophora immunda]OQV09585.1 Fungal specific transcription factor domain-containing protein [Cladophialophora immunda]
MASYQLSAPFDLEPTHSWSPQESAAFERFGPRAILAICSDRALKWLQARVTAGDEQTIANTVHRLALDSTGKFSFGRDTLPTQNLDPDFKTAREYGRAFFECRADSYFEIVKQDDFEERLHRHFDPQAAPDLDPSWHALRNTIYALGSRLFLADKGYDPKVIHNHAWYYFEKALSAYSQILFSSQKDLVGIQALTLMSFFAENIVTFRVEYILCSTAVRLAQALGLNHEQGQARRSHFSDSDRRIRIWWALYCYDKLISLRDGRPSCIDDDDISCPLPTPRAGENIDKFNAFLFTILHAQLSSKIYRRILSAKAWCGSGDEQRQVIRAELERELYHWRDSLPPWLRPGVPAKSSTIPEGVHIDSVVYIHYAFYGSMIAIYNQYPWDDLTFPSGLIAAQSQYMADCREKVVGAARNIILATKYHRIDSNTTSCLVFAYPLMAVTALLVNILQFPMATSAQLDVVLLDVAARHFAKLELATSNQVEVQFARDIANIARRKVEDVKENLWAEVAPSNAAMVGLPDAELYGDMTNMRLDFMDFLSDDTNATSTWHP